MAEKTAAQKMLIKPGMRGYLIHAPADAESLVGGLPEGFTRLEEPGELADFILFFAGSRQEAAAELPGVKALLKPSGLIWVAYHKGTSGVKTDLNRDILREAAVEFGLEAVSLVAINADWAAMRFKVVG